jgi:hypothetical protein
MSPAVRIFLKCRDTLSDTSQVLFRLGGCHAVVVRESKKTVSLGCHLKIEFVIFVFADYL